MYIRIGMKRIQVHCVLKNRKKKGKQENEYKYSLSPCISSQSTEGLAVRPLQNQHIWVKNSPQKTKQVKWVKSHTQLTPGGPEREVQEGYQQDVIEGLTMQHIPRNSVCTAPVTAARQGTGKQQRLLKSPKIPTLSFAKWFSTKKPAPKHRNNLSISRQIQNFRTFSPERGENHPM